MCFELCASNDVDKNNFIVDSLKCNLSSYNACHLKCVQLENVK